MKSKFLKIAKVKDEASFYKKYPSEAAFFKAHPEAKKLIKKAQSGTAIPGMETPVSLIPYITNAEKDAREQALLQAQQPKEKEEKKGGMDMGQMAQMAMMFAKYGAYIPKAQDGNIISLSDSELNNSPDQQWGNYLAPAKQRAGDKSTPSPLGSLPIIGGIVKGFEALEEEKKARKRAEQDTKVTNVQALAAESRDVDTPNVLARNINKQRDAMFQPTQPDQLFPTYGVGTNVLAAKNGTEIQNTFAPYTMYTDAAYEPLDDSNIKQYREGGAMRKAQMGDQMSGMGGAGGGADFFSAATPYAGSIGSSMGGGKFQNNAGSQIGGGIGKGIGSAFGPGGAQVGEFAGSMIGGALDTIPGEIEAFEKETQGNQDRITGSAFSKGIQAQNSGYMEHGGNLTNPQLITKFGEYDVKDLFYPDPTMDTLRVGGHLKSFTPPSQHGLQEYAMGGDLKTHWGGHAETMSQNPYLPASGETVMFRGNSHDESDGKGRTGIGITYGESPVEVERGEPAVKLENGGEENLTVFGNLHIPKNYLDVIGDPNAQNKKFKTYVADLSNKEEKQNKIINKSSEAIDEHKNITPIDKLTFNSHQAMLQGANSKLKKYAEFKQNAASLQNAINETAEEHGIVAEDLAKGKTTIDKKARKEQAKYGKELLKAQFGVLKPLVDTPQASMDNTQASGLMFPGSGVSQSLIAPQALMSSPQAPIDYSFGVPGGNTASFSQDVPSNHYSNLTPEQVNELNDLYTKASAYEGKGSSPVVKQFQRRYHELLPNVALNILQNDPEGGITALGKKNKLKRSDLFTGSNTADVLAQDNEDGYFAKMTKQYKAALDNLQTAPAATAKTAETTPVKTEEAAKTTTKETTKAVEAKKRNPYLDLLGEVMPYLTPSFKNPLDANQLLGENYALGRNQVDPVQAQLYHPELANPYDISLQDQLNEATAASNAARRMSQGNPAAQAAIAAQESMDKSEILGKKFRMNQAEKAGVYNQNRATLNDAQLKNLGIMDQQYTRQSQAKSNAQALTQSALNSISDKVQKNRLETMGYNVYANKFPGYTFTSEGKLIKNPGIYQFENPTVGSTTAGRGKQTAPEGFEYLYDDQGNVKKMQNKAKEKAARNGALVKAFKKQ